MIGEIARTFEQVVVGTSYNESLPPGPERPGPEIVDGFPEPLPPPTEGYPSPPLDPGPTLQVDPPAEAAGVYRSDVCLGQSANGPPGRFFPVPTRPVFAPRP
ncbi:MAG: hypothetical protein ACR2NU_00275 [Aeoliella sp.]